MASLGSGDEHGYGGAKTPTGSGEPLINTEARSGLTCPECGSVFDAQTNLRQTFCSARCNCPRKGARSKVETFGRLARVAEPSRQRAAVI